MAEMLVHRAGAEHHISGSIVLYATIASLVIDGPLLGMMGFALLATTTLVLVTAPLMLLFSPVIVPAVLVLAASMVGFGVAVGTAFVGLSDLTWAFRTVGWMVAGGLGRVMGMVRESRERVKEQWMDFGRYLHRKGQAYKPRIWQNWAGAEHHISGSTVLYATIASLVIGGPLLGMMGFALLATTTLVLVAAPLMLLFSPVIVPAVLVLAASMVGYGVAVGTAFVGLAVLTWAFRTVGCMVPGGLGRVTGMMTESGERVKEQGMDFVGYLRQKGQAYEPRIWQSRTT